MARLHAILVGVDSYADPSIPALRYACQDAQALGALLTGSDLGTDITVRLLLDGAATRRSVLHAVGAELPARVHADDMVLFYFAGHGSPELLPGVDELSRFLVCHDSARNSLLSSAIDVAADLARLAVRLPGRLVLFVIDACFSGYAGGRGIAGAALEERRRRHRPAARMADLALGSGIAYLSACGDDEVAAEDRALRHGVFTYHLLRQLTASGEPRATIGLPTLYDLVFQQVHSYSAGRQNPVLWGNIKGANLPLFGRSH
jgi:uncharacterized caspase-like protein